MPASAAEIGDTNRSGFGSKKALLRAAMDVAVVDAEPVPFVERDEFHRLARGPLAERMEAGVTVVTAIHERSAGSGRRSWKRPSPIPRSTTGDSTSTAAPST